MPEHKPCARCTITFYCSARCQKKHWKEGGHKQHCVPVANRHVPMDLKTGVGACAEEAARAAAEQAIEPECAICLEPLSESESQQLPCSHVYHLACVEKLREFGIRQTCPMCRADLHPGPEQMYEGAVRRWWILDRHYGGDTDASPWRTVSQPADSQELAEIMRMLHEAAEQRHEKAQFNLGSMYQHGKGVEKDEVAGAQWYRKAADQGFASAQNNLGLMYHQGTGVPQSFAMAAEWYRKAADQGVALAQCNLGTMYKHGNGVERDDAKAAEWFLKSSESGDAEGQFNLAIIYEDGNQGLPQSSKNAALWYLKAAQQGHMSAMNNLGGIYRKGNGLPQDYTRAIEWYSKAAEKGCANAMYNLGTMYHHGQGMLQKDAAAAAKAYLSAAKQGMGDAQYSLGIMFMNGQGVAKDIDEALRWLHRAQRQGVEGSSFAIETALKQKKRVRCEAVLPPGRSVEDLSDFELLRDFMSNLPENRKETLFTALPVGSGCFVTVMVVAKWLTEVETPVVLCVVGPATMLVVVSLLPTDSSAIAGAFFSFVGVAYAAATYVLARACVALWSLVEGGGCYADEVAHDLSHEAPVTCTLVWAATVRLFLTSVFLIRSAAQASNSFAANDNKLATFVHFIGVVFMGAATTTLILCLLMISAGANFEHLWQRLSLTAVCLFFGILFQNPVWLKGLLKAATFNMLNGILDQGPEKV